jgi:hypothetical protein
VRRDISRTEAEIQADVRQFILSAPSELEETDLTIVSLEAAVGNRQRIDVEVGSTVIEVKRDQRDKFAMQAYAAAQHQLDMIFASHYKRKHASRKIALAEPRRARESRRIAKERRLNGVPI